jgi:hypothetical protein
MEQHLRWLLCLYVETVKMLKKKSPFKSVAQFYAAVLTADDQRQLELMMIDITARDVRIVNDAERSASQLIRVNGLQLQHLVHVYVSFCKKCRSVVNESSQSPFHNIKAFYAGIGLTQYALDRISLLSESLPTYDQRIVDSCEALPRARKRLDVEKNKVLAGDLNTIQYLLGTMGERTIDAMRAATDPLQYLIDAQIFVRYPGKRAKFEMIGIDCDRTVTTSPI